jgi:hypothetical protein
MKKGLLLALALCLTGSSAHAVADIAFGAFGGMIYPTVNDDAESGNVFGLQARVSLTSFLALGARYRQNSFGNPEHTFFEGTPNEFTSEKDGGSVNSFTVDAYLGKVGGMPGLDLYLMGSVGNYSWSRDYTDDRSELSYSGGLGLEFIIEGGLGFEGRGVAEVIPKPDDRGSWKNVYWTFGINYHFGDMLE